MKIDQKENLCNTMITDFMASAKQIAWRKKFARMSKAGKFKKSKKSKSKKFVAKISSAYGKTDKKIPLSLIKGGGIQTDYFNEYKRLGGKKSRRQFDQKVAIFIDNTWDIFIHGDPSKYNSRQEALEAVKKGDLTNS